MDSRRTTSKQKRASTMIENKILDESGTSNLESSDSEDNAIKARREQLFQIKKRLKR